MMNIPESERVCVKRRQTAKYRPLSGELFQNCFQRIFIKKRERSRIWRDEP